MLTRGHLGLTSRFPGGIVETQTVSWQQWLQEEGDKAAATSLCWLKAMDFKDGSWAAGQLGQLTDPWHLCIHLGGQGLDSDQPPAVCSFDSIKGPVYHQILMPWFLN